MAVLALTSLLGMSYLLVSLPWLWRPLPRPREINVGNETVLFVSDLHLKDAKSVPVSLSEVIMSTEPSTLVVVGDLLHSPNEVSSDEEFEGLVRDILERADRKKNLRRALITLSENHDPPLPHGDLKFEHRNAEVTLGHSPILVESSGTRVLAIHGDYFCSDGAVTAVVEAVLSAFGIRGAAPRLLRRAAGLDRKDWVVMGHTHVPMIDHGLRIANCGSFHSHLMRSASETAVLLQGGQLRMVGGSNR